MDERKGVEGTNAARDKPMSPDSSAQPEHAAWQKWRRRPPIGPAHARSLGASSPCEVDSTREKDLVCSSWFFTRSSMQIQAWPVHQIRPNLGVGLCRWIDGMKRRGRAVQGVRTVRGFVVGFRMNLGMTCMLDPWPRKNCWSRHSS